MGASMGETELNFGSSDSSWVLINPVSAFEDYLLLFLLPSYAIIQISIE